MKPINLKIKGLNSFQEEQSIDFLNLQIGGSLEYLVQQEVGNQLF